MVKKTIAILGDTGKLSTGLMEDLMRQDLRLLFISENDSKNIELKGQLEQANTAAEVEFTSCEREGCWEADIIALTPQESISTGLIQKIKEVATQKIVLVFSEENKTNSKADLNNLLPYSKVIEIQINPVLKEFYLTGKDAEALHEVSSIFEKTGYTYKIKNDAGKNMV